MNTFIQQAYIKVIKSYSKGIIMLQKICISYKLVFLFNK